MIIFYFLKPKVPVTNPERQKRYREKLKENLNTKEWNAKESERCKVKRNVNLEATTAKDRETQRPHNARKKA